MTRYTDIGHGRFYTGDCFDVMPTLPDRAVNLVLCDLPYGTTQNKWDSVLPLDRLWAKYRRLCTGAVVLTAAQPFTSALVMSNLKGFKYQWVWEKSTCNGFLNAHKRPLVIHEDVVVFGGVPYYPQGLVPYQKTKRRVHHGSDNYGTFNPENFQEWTNYPRSILRFPSQVIGKNIHPTQKPVALFEYLIKTYTNEGDLVLDNCAGSGTTAIACENTGRRWICIERDETYAQAAIARIERHLSLLLAPDVIGALNTSL